MKPTLVIMAAGMGSRYGGLKQIDPIGPSGELVIDYSIYDALRAGFETIVFIIRNDIEKAFRDSIGKRIERQTQVEYVFQDIASVPEGFKVSFDRVKPWGTGHAVLMASTKVKGSFGVINADDFYGATSFRILADFLKQSASDQIPTYSLVGFELEKTLSDHGSVSRGVCECSPDGYLKNITEFTKIVCEADGIYHRDDQGQVNLARDILVSMNMWGFNDSLFPDLHEEFINFLKQNANNPKAEFGIPTPIAKFIQNQKAKVKVLRTIDQWFGVTYPEDKPTVVSKISKLIHAKEYPATLWKS